LNRVEISLLLPALCEDENLRELLPKVKSVLKELNLTYEILVIDSIQELDCTRAVCEEHAVKHIRRSPTNSFGDALRTGIKLSNGEWIVFMDADGSHDPKFLEKIRKKMADFDVIIASRYTTGGSNSNPWHLLIYSRLLNFIFGIISGENVKDISNNFKAYRAHLLKPLVLKSHGFNIVEEIFLEVVHSVRGLRIVEIPFHFKRRIYGQSKRELLSQIAGYLKLLMSVYRK